MKYRIEKDFLGEAKIPENAYWGIHTKRAIDNFKISPYKINLTLIKAMAMVKKACCLANEETGYLKPEKAKAISAACDEIIQGKLINQFPIDAMQGAAGTSTNMNLNEVIANRAIEILGGKKGDYSIIHPLDDVNNHQSTNDVFPTAVKVAIIDLIRKLSAKIEKLQDNFQKKEKEFAAILKTGRTQLQSAVPMTLGSEFSAFSQAISRDRWRVFKCEERIREVNIGGTAIGTGITAPKSYIFTVIEKLRSVTGFPLSRAENVIDNTSNTDVFVEVAGILNAHAANLAKISNDMRLLNLLGEIKPENLQIGSSIMPGKINPVVFEAAIQSTIKINANERIIFDTVTKSTFQINEFLPLISFSILESLDILININEMLSNHIKTVEADVEKCMDNLEKNPMLITAFISAIGYEKTYKILEKFKNQKEKNIKKFLIKKLGKEIVEKTLSVQNMTALARKDYDKNS